ncbi:homoserine dehydrogenase [Alkalicoccobacillus porphyridii]|uniref:Homoserine dehydrogenase n=1 Tax=Alkalicoccobacillus porphyridii TaxID=2597270 RepID=A0A554A425_9BACI|nr:homoserine dehydrogenase [Alkalicoccobacillus porphyridii]TSB48437.1 homoserine dehydrogenase [Alkalicoccobacillus porphyridii]
MRLYISGYGTVSRALIELLLKNKDRYPLTLQVVGIIGREGLLEDQAGLDLEKLLQAGSGSSGIRAYAEQEGINLQSAYTFKGDALIEATPTNMNDGDPAYSYIKQALQDGLDVVTISKGALVHHFHELSELTLSKQSVLKYSGAVAAALPTLDVGQYCLAGSTITGFEAVLNGTSNYILTEMMDDQTYREALQQAQNKGIAESDPSLDVCGVDSANKLVILANSLFIGAWSYSDVEVVGIETLKEEEVTTAKQRNQTIRLVAKAEQLENRLSLSVKPELLEKDHLLSIVKGTNKGIVFRTEEMGDLFVSGGASSPTGAAAAAIKDLLNIRRK